MNPKIPKDIQKVKKCLKTFEKRGIGNSPDISQSQPQDMYC